MSKEQKFRRAVDFSLTKLLEGGLTAADKNDKLNIAIADFENEFNSDEDIPNFVLNYQAKNKPKSYRVEKIPLSSVDSHIEALQSYFSKINNPLSSSEYQFQEHTITNHNKRLRASTTELYTKDNIVVERNCYSEGDIRIAGGKVKNINVENIAEAIKEQIRSSILTNGTGVIFLPPKLSFSIGIENLRNNINSEDVEKSLKKLYNLENGSFEVKEEGNNRLQVTLNKDSINKFLSPDLKSEATKQRDSISI
jgi:hypothetical protein